VKNRLESREGKNVSLFFLLSSKKTKGPERFLQDLCTAVVPSGPNEKTLEGYENVWRIKLIYYFLFEKAN